jgi:uncharacterized protein YndB with AHSA1/START domain
MGTFRLQTTIDRPPDEVFAVVADPATMPLWYDAVTQATQTSPGSATTGATYQITRSLPGGLARNDVEISEHTPHRRVILESRAGPTPFRYCYTLEPDRSGTTLTLDARISGAGLPGRVSHFDRLATQLFKQGMRRNLHQLKRLVERGHGVPRRCRQLGHHVQTDGGPGREQAFAPVLGERGQVTVR